MLEKGSIVLPIASDPLTAPMVSNPGTIACGETRAPGVATDSMVRPSPPAQSFKSLPEAEASGEATTTVYAPAGSVRDCMASLLVAVQGGHDQLHRVRRHLANQTGEPLVVELGGRIVEQQAGLHR